MLKARGHLEDLDVDGTIILKKKIKDRHGEYAVGSAGTVYAQVASSCKDTWLSIKCGKFFD
jgi:hypothetical protein